MPAHLTPAEARRLGIGKASSAAAGDDGERPRPARRRRSPYHTICHDCGEQFRTRAAETDHLEATRHGHYQLVLPI